MAIDKTDPFPNLPRRSFFANALASVPADPPKMRQKVEVANAAMDAPKRKRGRPVADKPWEAAGVSRMTWYRRRKAGK